MVLISPPLVANARSARFLTRPNPTRSKNAVPAVGLQLASLYDSDAWRNIETAFRHAPLGRVQQTALLAADCASTEQIRVVFLDLATHHADNQVRTRLVQGAEAQHRIVAGTSGRPSGLQSVAKSWNQDLHGETLEQYRRTCISATKQRTNSDGARLAAATGQLLLRKYLVVALRLRSDLQEEPFRSAFTEIYECLDESWNCATIVAASMVDTGNVVLPRFCREVNRAFRQHRDFFTQHAQL